VVGSTTNLSFRPESRRHAASRLRLRRGQQGARHLGYSGMARHWSITSTAVYTGRWRRTGSRTTLRVVIYRSPVVPCRSAPDAQSHKSQQAAESEFRHRPPTKWRARSMRPASQDNVIMKAKLAIMILGAFVLITNGANARQRTDSHGYTRGETAYQSSGGLYGSFSQGQQPYPNPDRELYVNRSCCE
jgi:hypothetical protein